MSTCHCQCSSFKEHIRSVSFPHRELPRVNATESQWSRDMAAYSRLRREGLQPPGIDGAARREALAAEPHEVEGKPKPLRGGW